MDSKKIYILGGLGYLGFNLCKLLKPSYSDIVVIDSNFNTEAYCWLRDNDIKYIRKDIFQINDLSDAKIVINLISETLVPQTKEQSSPEIDKKIEKVGTNGNRHIMTLIPKGCKYLFVSSHVIYENLKENIIVDEDLTPCPSLAYGTSKATSEQDLKNSDLDYIVLRLASVFGIGGPTSRWRIVTNLFALMTAIDKKIKIFGPKVIKPIVGLEDVCRAIKFFIESNYTREIFNCVSDHRTIEELALICKKFAPNLEIEYSNQEVQNNGYTLSNAKILKTGFTFSQSIEEEIGRMIQLWS